MTPYVSARPRARSLRALVAVQIILLTIIDALWLLARSFYGVDGRRALDLLHTMQGLAWLDTLVFFCATYFFLAWVHRATANLPALNDQLPPRFSPGEAVGSFFVPILNLVRGYQIVAAIWTQSQPITDEASYVAARSPALVGWWWGTNVAFGVMTVLRPHHPHGIDGAKAHALWMILSLLLRIVCACFFLAVIGGAQRRQDEQWRDLELRRAVPQPSAEALR